MLTVHSFSDLERDLTNICFALEEPVATVRLTKLKAVIQGLPAVNIRSVSMLMGFLQKYPLIRYSHFPIHEWAYWFWLG